MSPTTSTSHVRPAALVSSRAFLLLCMVSSLLGVARAITVDDWRSRSVYQVITDRFALANGSTTQDCPFGTQKICGGTFKGVERQLDYIQGMGFTAVYISPVTTVIEGTPALGEAYHGFWPKDITTINANMGTPQDLKDLAKALHDRGMLFMIDVVANNMAWAGGYATVDYSQYHPWNDQKYFHPYCPITDYGNWTLAQECWLSGTGLSLPDIDTESPTVIEFYTDWAKGMVSNYSVDGFRIDAAKHVGRPFWAKFQPAVGIYMVGEVFDASTEAVCSYQNNKDALPGVLNYGMWYSIVTTFRNDTQSMNQLYYQSVNVVDTCQDSTLLGTFTENQDVARIGNVTTDVSHQMNALAWALMSDGIPIIYYGSEQGLNAGGDPYNREALWLTNYDTTGPLYALIRACNEARNVIAKLATYKYWTPYWTWKTKVVCHDDNVLCVRKGYDRSVLTLVTNKGSNAPAFGPITVGDTNFIYGDTIVDLVGCTSMLVGQYGVVNITMPAGGKPMVWIQAKYVADSKLCPNLKLSQWKGFKSALAEVQGNVQIVVEAAAAKASASNLQLSSFAVFATGALAALALL